MNQYSFIFTVYSSGGILEEQDSGLKVPTPTLESYLEPTNTLGGTEFQGLFRYSTGLF